MTFPGEIWPRGTQVWLGFFLLAPFFWDNLYVLNHHHSSYPRDLLDTTGCPKKMHFQNAACATVHWLNHHLLAPIVHGD